MGTPTIEVMCTDHLQAGLSRLLERAGGQCLPDEQRELRILFAEIVRARALQRYNDDRQIRLQLPGDEQERSVLNRVGQYAGR